MELLNGTDLAVVIPAYKGKYFGETLESLARQSDVDFNVYIGDDCSPEPLAEIVARFNDRLHIRYVRFEENLGGRDLVAQWNRCLALAGREEFVCIFSDDDVMTPDCIRSFRQTVQDYPGHDVYHWDIEIVDTRLAPLRKTAPWDDFVSSADFYADLYMGRIDARMPEFIFRKKALEENGFVQFDLAFRTDNATVMEVASCRGIRNIGGVDRILWRDSGENVSSFLSGEYVERRSMATIDFFNWTEDFFRNVPYPLPRKRYRTLLCRNLAWLAVSWPSVKIYGQLGRYEYFRNADLLHKLKYVLRLRHDIHKKKIELKKYDNYRIKG